MNSDEALTLILADQKIIGATIADVLHVNSIAQNDEVNNMIHFEDSFIAEFSAPMLFFNKKVVFKNCKIGKIDSQSNYFFDGLEVSRCEFDSMVNFQSGGHNNSDAVILIENSIFNEFVNFFDCWFNGPLVLLNNQFRKGTNILGNTNQPYEVTFDIEPRIEGNVGQLNLDGG